MINHPQEKCSGNFCAKSKENFLLPKIYESKNVNVGIKIQHIFQSWKEDKSIDMDILCMYKHLSVGILPQNQITEIILCFLATSCKPFISKFGPIFVLKDN